jgi:Glycosyl transferase family 2
MFIAPNCSINCFPCYTEKFLGELKDHDWGSRPWAAQLGLIKMALSNLSASPGSPVPEPGSNGENAAADRMMPRYRPISAALAIAPTVSVILPARNEAYNLPHVFSTLPPWIDEIILVDGHSIDDTVALTRVLCPRAKVITQSGNGKGDALQAGFAAATGEIIVTIDADGSTDGAEIVKFVGALVTGADFAKGSRFSGSGRSDDITGVRRCGNRILNMLVNRMFRTQFTDLCYGYNAFWAYHLDALQINCAGFEIETLMNIRAAKLGLKIQEVPSHERRRIFGTSNLRAFRDGWRILKVILREKFSDFRERDACVLAPTVPIPALPGVLTEAVNATGEGG